MPASRPLEIRFWEKVLKRPGGGCWEWLTTVNHNGYGLIGVTGHGTQRAHRVSWFLHHGEMPPKRMMVLHRCDNRRCVRPDHLFLGTARTNTEDMMIKGRHRAHKGAESHKAKLCDDDVRLMRHWAAPTRELSEFFKISPTNVRAIMKGQTWKHLLK